MDGLRCLLSSLTLSRPGLSVESFVESLGTFGSLLSTEEQVFAGEERNHIVADHANLTLVFQAAQVILRGLVELGSKPTEFSLIFRLLWTTFLVAKGKHSQLFFSLSFFSNPFFSSPCCRVSVFRWCNKEELRASFGFVLQEFAFVITDRDLWLLRSG